MTTYGSTRTSATTFRFATSTSVAQRLDAGTLGALTMVAHDLRSPLANLVLLIEAMGSAARVGNFCRLDACKRRAHSLIEHLDGLLKSVLHRACANGDPLRIVDPVRIELGNIVDTAVALNRPIAECRSISVIRAGHDSLAVLGDRHLLIEALDNLLNNAIKHSEAGTSIDCTLLKQGSCAVIRIEDRGCGLSELQIRGVFQPFACPQGYRSAGGPGIGLWIARIVAERHGGHIEVTSHGINLGAVFELHLPIAPMQPRSV